MPGRGRKKDAGQGGTAGGSKKVNKMNLAFPDLLEGATNKPCFLFSEPARSIGSKRIAFVKKEAVEEACSASFSRFSYGPQCIGVAMNALQRELGGARLQFGMVLKQNVKDGTHTKVAGPFFLIFSLESAALTRQDLLTERYYVCDLVHQQDGEWTCSRDLGDIPVPPQKEQPRQAPEMIVATATGAMPETTMSDAGPEEPLPDSEETPEPPEHRYFDLWSTICSESMIGVSDSLPKSVFFRSFVAKIKSTLLTNLDLSCSVRIVENLIKILVDENDMVSRKAFIAFCKLCDYGSDKMKIVLDSLSSCECFMALSLNAAGCILRQYKNLLNTYDVLWLIRFSLSSPGSLSLTYLSRSGQIGYLSVETSTMIQDPGQAMETSTMGSEISFKVDFDKNGKPMKAEAKTIEDLVNELFKPYRPQCCPMERMEGITHVSKEEIMKWILSSTDSNQIGNIDEGKDDESLMV